MRISEPMFIASEELVWLKADGSEVNITARVGLPYKGEGDEEYCCPAELVGVDRRYPDIVGTGSMQALCLATQLLASRLGHLLEEGERLVYRRDRSDWDVATLNAVFGR